MTRRTAPSGDALGGPRTRAWLATIGVTTIEDIRRLGPVAIYHVLKEQGYPVSLNLVYALEGALLGVPWNRLPPDVKAELRSAVKGLRQP